MLFGATLHRRAALLCRAAMLLAVGCAVVLPGTAHAQYTTKNQFVAAVETIEGLLTLYVCPAPPLSYNGLTFPEESYLTVEVNGLYYTNNPNVDTNAAQTLPDILLTNAKTTKIADTLHTVWKEPGFEIVQNTYPVAFKSSGVIVISIKIVNQGALGIPAQAQYLLDNENSTSSTSNDAPFTITRYGYIPNTSCWQNCPPNPIPSFDLTFENPPSSGKPGTVGLGYFNDSLTPSPLGLLPPSLVQFGYWPDQVYIPWGPCPPSTRWVDNATLMMGPQGLTATAFNAGVSDSVTEIFRTAYGTPEWCYVHGQIVGIALYPQHITWNPVTMAYTPNPFQVETFLFTADAGAAGGTTIRQTVSNPIHITSPKPTGPTNNDTTQLQTVGSIGGSGVAQVYWMDSAIVSPAPCMGSFPVDINFDVKTGNLATPTFTNSWGCSITVDCAHPDITPPKFHNSFAGCDSIFNDTITVHDDTLYDNGLKDITYTSPDLKPAQYSVTINPPPPYPCIDSSAKIFVQQLDSVHGGQVIFTFTDCANNVSMDTVCFTSRLDLTAPRFWIDSLVTDCHAQCQEWSVTDTAKSDTSVDRGVDSIIVVSATNMTLSGVPVKGKYPTGTPEATFHVCVTDSLLDGTIILRANDTSHNFSFDTITYCTTPDTLPPVITAQAYNPTDSSWHIHVTETRPWDRGIDSVWLEQTSNVTSSPLLPVHPAGCPSTFDFRVIVIDTSQCASAMVYAKDCAGNVSSPTPLSFTKGAIPVIVASKKILCKPTDSAVLDAGTGYSGYLWSNGDATQKITVGAGVYSVTVQEGAGCPATSKPDTITLSPATPLITPSSPPTMCAPDSVQLDAGPGYATYQWLKDGSNIPGSETIWANSTGNYTVQVTNAAGCTGTSPAVTVTINPPPPVPVITSVNNVMTATPPSTSYQWSRNGTPIPGATSQTYTDLTGGSYTVTITDANGCSNTSQPFSNSGLTLICLSAMVRAQESNQVTIPLTVCSSQTTPSGNLNFTTKIAFNKTLLIPNGSPSGGIIGPITMKGDSLIVEYTGTGSAASGTVLLNLPFIAALGDDSCTAVTIDSFAWSVPNIAVSVKNDTFCLTNLCYQGGTQLIDPNGTVSLAAPQPNPASSSIAIGYQLIEKGPTTLIVYDLLGHEVLRLLDGTATPGTYTASADVSGLAAGTYIYSLHTPTVVKSDYLKIAR